MSNSIGWGQGANNNGIGWGQGAFNNSIGWGSSHYVSYAGETEIVGNEGGLAYDFSVRISADSGVFEANSCLLTSLNNLEIIS
jgi:hypothetical protein